MFSCTLCEKETCYVSKFCTNCRKIKHLLNLYGDDVYSTLDKVLVRSKDQQNYKIENSIKPKIERNLENPTPSELKNQKLKLRNGKKI